ncbi:MAG TPA: hypothetical protein VJ327_06245 [Patescibacteria group bacterium]|nr:hypothetical protein [Patescibacteria group bacterium]
MSNLLYIGVPVFMALVAIGLSKFIVKKEYPVKKWHGGLGIVISGCMLFFMIGVLQNTPYDIPFLIASMILLVVSFSVYKAAENILNKNKNNDKSSIKK